MCYVCPSIVNIAYVRHKSSNINRQSPCKSRARPNLPRLVPRVRGDTFNDKSKIELTCYFLLSRFPRQRTAAFHHDHNNAFTVGWKPVTTMPSDLQFEVISLPSNTSIRLQQFHFRYLLFMTTMMISQELLRSARLTYTQKQDLWHNSEKWPAQSELLSPLFFY